MFKSKKLYWYLVVLEGAYGRKEELSFSSNIKWGFNSKVLNDIRALGSPECNLITNLIYLGHMTKKDFNNLK